MCKPRNESTSTIMPAFRQFQWLSLQWDFSLYENRNETSGPAREFWKASGVHSVIGNQNALQIKIGKKKGLKKIQPWRVQSILWVFLLIDILKSLLGPTYSKYEMLMGSTFFNSTVHPYQKQCPFLFGSIYLNWCIKSWINLSPASETEFIIFFIFWIEGLKALDLDLPIKFGLLRYFKFGSINLTP